MLWKAHQSTDKVNLQNNCLNSIILWAVGQPWQQAQHETRRRQAHDVLLCPFCYTSLKPFNRCSTTSHFVSHRWFHFGIIYERLSTEDKKIETKKRQEEIEDSRIIILKESSFIFWFSGALPEIFNFHFFFLSCFLLVLLPFDYDDYDPKRFKISNKRENSIERARKTNAIKL